MYLFFILVQHSFTVFNTHMFIYLFIHLFPGLNYMRIPSFLTLDLTVS